MSQELIVRPAGNTPPPGRLSYEEYLAWLDSETHAEWVDGDVLFMSPVTDRHSDLVLEIVSEESRRRDRVEKLREYEQGGVGEYWVLDPERQEALFYQTGPDGAYQLAPVEAGIYRSRILPGLWLRMEWLWQEPLPPVLAVAREWGLV